MSLIGVVCFAWRAPAQQPAAPATAAATATIQLIPLVVVEGKRPGEVDLSVDIDSTGKVVHSALISGDPKLFKPAEKAISIFLYRDHAGVMDAKAHVSFLIKKDLHNPNPEYPAIARAAHVRGEVELAGLIEPDGHVSKITVISGPPMFIGSATDAFRKWVFPSPQPSASSVQPRVLVSFDYDLW
ncbi:MAG TPA: energy transducer TonB [Acidobacteriaceae bacterium]